MWDGFIAMALLSFLSSVSRQAVCSLIIHMADK